MARNFVSFFSGFSILFFVFNFALAQENFLKIPGRIEGTGKHFEIKDSQYLNITLESSEEINLILESIPRIISLHISSSTSATFTNLIIRNLEPNKTYYKYQNSYKNEIEFVSDENGNYSWTQDLTRSHHIWIQEEKGTIFLPEDCTEYGDWNEETRTCILKQDIKESVEITTSTITLDCNNFSISGSGKGVGILVLEKNNVTIQNCNITNFGRGIFLEGQNNKLLKNNIFGNLSDGIFLHYSFSSEIEENNIYSNRYFGGLIIQYGGSNFVRKNSIFNNSYYGLHIFSSPFNFFQDNSLYNNRYNFSIVSVWWKRNNDAIQYIDTSNTVNGRPIYYLINQENKIVDESLNPGFIGVVNSKNITIKKVKIENNRCGIYLENVQDSKIEEVELENNAVGLALINSSRNEIKDSKFQNNEGSGIEIEGECSQNKIFNNLIANNAKLSSAAGINYPRTIPPSAFSFNEIFENTFIQNGRAIWATNNWYSNKIYHNNFINNGKIPYIPQVEIRGSENVFDEGYPSGGNY